MATKEEILDAIANMTVLELSELLSEFEEKFGVTAAAPVAVAASGPRAGPKPLSRRWSRLNAASAAASLGWAGLNVIRPS